MGFLDHVSYTILLEKYKHIQQEVDQWLVFIVIRQRISSFRLNIINKKLTQTPAKSRLFLLQYDRKFHLCVQFYYTKILYLRKNTHLRKDAAFLYFSLRESSENIMFPSNGNLPQKNLTKTIVYINTWLGN